MNTSLKLGTRRSLLAWAQSSWVAREVEKLNPGVQVELVGIETRGDRIQDISLRNVAGKEFFVAEIDDALREGRVDFTVHSMKDLSLDRPPEFTCAAIPERENPRDVILFGPNALEHLRNNQKLKIGTSSPRRIENIPGFLEKALPHIGTSAPQIEFIEIRGNVNTRLSRVHEPVTSPKYLDAVVLAFAGINRLWADSAGKMELKKLLPGVKWMVLPLKECPAAPAQGALAIECRTNDTRTREVLGKLHHIDSQERVALERQVLEDWGGGCHQRFGATAVQFPVLGKLMFIRGAKPDGSFVEEVRWKKPDASISKPIRAWDGTEWRSAGGESTNAEYSEEILFNSKSAAFFVGHSRAMPASWVGHLNSARIWTSGTASWFRLAKMGIWVEGCAESLGFTFLHETIKSGPLGLPELSQWIVLTHQDADSEWRSLGMRVIPTYQVNSSYGNQAKESLQQASHVFWSSGSQFDELKGFVQNLNVIHACGAGKTATRLQQEGLQPLIFPSVEEWRKWLKIHKSV